MELFSLLAAVYFLGGILSMVFMVAFLFEEIKKDNVISTLFLFFLGWWSFGYYFWLRPDYCNCSSFLVGIFNVGFIFIPVVYYNWIVSILKKTKRKIVISVGYLLATLFTIFYSYNLHRSGVDIFNPTSFVGFVFIFYFIFFHIGFYILGLIELINGIIKCRGIEMKNIRRNMLLISILAIMAGILNLPAFYGIKYFLYSGLISVILNIFLVVYVILSYKLINLKIFCAQSLVGLILSINIIEMIFSNTILEVSYRFVMLLFLLIFSNLLIRNYKQDIIHKEELEKMGKRLEANNKRLKELDDAKNEFISIAAHQLRTPPTVIKGYLALAKEDPNNNLDVETKDSLSRAFASNERLIELVEDILNISRIESGKMQYDFQPNQSIGQIINELCSGFEPRIKDKGLKLKVKIDEDVPTITMDTNKMREVISNLVDNAIKYTSEGSITIELARTQNNMVRLAVSDTGMGISRSDIGELFKKFSRGSNADQLAAGGIGLGIYVGRKIVEAHSGRIWAESAGIEKGSTFVIELPIEQ